MFELEAAGRNYCEEHWDALRDQHNEIDYLDLLKYCFSSAYMVALLHDVLGIPMEEKRYTTMYLIKIGKIGKNASILFNFLYVTKLKLHKGSVIHRKLHKGSVVHRKLHKGSVIHRKLHKFHSFRLIFLLCF